MSGEIRSPAYFQPNHKQMTLGRLAIFATHIMRDLANDMPRLRLIMQVLLNLAQLSQLT